VSSKKNLSNEVIIKNDNKLLNIKRFLKKYDLLNNKNLIKRKNIYYFSFYLQKDKNIQYSLNTNDFLLSNILKYKILLKIEERLKKMGLKEDYLKQFNTNLTVIKTDKRGPFIILCQLGKIENTKGHKDENRNRCRAIC
jgi:hypothetical protein